MSDTLRGIGYLGNELAAWNRDLWNNGQNIYGIALKQKAEFARTIRNKHFLGVEGVLAGTSYRSDTWYNLKKTSRLVLGNLLKTVWQCNPLEPNYHKKVLEEAKRVANSMYQTKKQALAKTQPQLGQEGKQQQQGNTRTLLQIPTSDHKPGKSDFRLQGNIKTSGPPKVLNSLYPIISLGKKPIL